MRVRCLTLNLAGLGLNWFEARRGNCLVAVQNLAPDILFLQETTVRLSGEPYDQASDVAQAAGLPAVFFAPYGNPAEVSADEQGGMAIASRWPWLYARFRQLPPGSKPPDARAALFARTESPGGEICLACTHLSWDYDEAAARTSQMAVFLEDCRRRGWLSAPTRFVFAGDMNAMENEPAVAKAKGYLNDTYRTKHHLEPGYTFSAENPFFTSLGTVGRVDYLFADRVARVVSSEVVCDNPPVSDHFGVTADLDWG